MLLTDILIRNAEECPEKTAIIYEDQLISYQTVYEHSVFLANFLSGAGIEKGDTVCLLLRKTPELIISFLGVAAIGGIVVPIDASQPPHRLQQLIDFISPSAMIADAGFQAMFAGLDNPCANEKVIVVGKGIGAPYRKWDEIFVENKNQPLNVSLHEDDPVYFNLTSGTTGMPKCAVTTHDNIYWNTLASIECLDLTRDDIHLCMFPPFLHPHEIFARPFYLGGTLVLADYVSPKSLSKVILENNVTCVMATASICETLLRHHQSTSTDFTRLRFCESGGMPTCPEFARQFKERFQAPIVPVWGSTETTGIALATHPKGPFKAGAMGTVCPYYEAKIVDKEGRELPPDMVGELAVKGPGVCSHYFNNPEETGNHMKDGWYFTGDLVKKDDEGFYFFVDRKTRMMKVGGLKVFPAEIEQVLNAHPGIDQAVVVNVRNDTYGEVPKAIIVLKNGTPLNKNDIRNYCKDNMAAYKVPRFFEFRDSLPRTPGGKIILKEL